MILKPKILSISLWGNMAEKLALLRGLGVTGAARGLLAISYIG